MEEKGIRLKNTDWKKDISEKVENFKPDLIGISSTEDMWELGVRVLREVKDYKIKNKVPVIAGGVFATFAPDLCLKEDLVDIACVGEGENALLICVIELKIKKVMMILQIAGLKRLVQSILKIEM